MMTITKLLIEFALQLVGPIGERIREAIGETLIKVPGSDASQRDIAIATKSAVSADREGKIASERARCSHPNVNVWTTNTGQSAAQCYACNRIEIGANDADVESKLRGAPQERRLGDYGPGGE